MAAAGHQMEQQWFKLADTDGDGAVGGAEAVRFFTRSGLPQDVLGQIWELASGGGARLNPMQFSTALRLVALAQASGGRLPPKQAGLVAMGTGPQQLPPPRLAGLTETPPTPSIPTYTPQITGLTPQVTGAGGVYTPQMTGAYTPQATGGVRPPYPYMPPQPTGSGPPSSHGGVAGLVGSGFTGGPPSVGGVAGGPPSAGGYNLTGGGAGGMPPQQQQQFAAAAAPYSQAQLQYPPGFAPPSAADMQRYLAVFAATDADRDGYVKGSECFPVFMQSGLDKGLLKRMWDLVAGAGVGQLGRDQFLRCMFLMDGLRRGLPLPAALPPGPWPQVAPAGVPAAAGMTGAGYAAPAAAAAAGGFGSRPGSVGGAAAPAAGFTGGQAAAAAAGLSVQQPPLRAESWSLSSQFGQKGATKAISDAYDQTLPKIPEPPGKVKYEGSAVVADGASAVPDLDLAVSSMLAPADKERWEAERAAAQQQETEQRQAEAEAANQKARLAVFQEALSELVMFKSRIDVAVLQASDSAARLQAEAEDLELRYNRAQLAAQSQAEAGSQARKQLQDLLARKAEAITKLQLLQQELEMAANLNPEELVALEREVGGLMAQTAAAEAHKAALDMQLDSGRKQKGLLADRISELQMAAAAGEGELRRATEELQQLQAAATSGGGPESAELLGQIKPLLGKAASAYRRLYSSAAAAGLEVPYEANINNVGALVWLEQLMAGTADWVDDESALSGYSVVNALPDMEGVPPALLRAAALAAAAAPPAKPPAMILGVTPATTRKEAADGADAAGAGAAAGAGKGGKEEEEEKEAAAAEAEAAAGGSVSKEATQADAAAAAGTVKGESSSKEAPVAAAGGKPGAKQSSSTSGKAGKVAAAAAAVAAGAGAGAAAAASNAEGGAAAVPADVPAADADAAPTAAADDDATDAAAEQEQLQQEAEQADIIEAAAAPAADAEAAEAVDVASPPAAAAPKTLLEDSDAESEEDWEAAVAPAAAPAAAAASAAVGLVPAVPQFGALAGFDPSLYRPAAAGGQLEQQHSIDSSYAGSFSGERRKSSLEAGLTGGGGAAGPSAGATGGFDDEPPAFGSSAAVGARSSSGGAGAGDSSSLGFEDNAF